jgi:hypothetical protein
MDFTLQADAGLTICGGLLLLPVWCPERSARTTFPELQNFRPGRVSCWDTPLEACMHMQPYLI